MSKRSKTVITSILIAMALFQGPYFYYFTSGFIRLLLQVPFAITGLVLSIILLFNLIIHRSSNSAYHVIGLAIAIIVGVFISLGHGMEILDFRLRLREREKIVERVKSGPVKSGTIIDQDFFPISNGGNISYTKNTNGTVYVEFYIDQGFLDHYSSFVYCNVSKETEPGDNAFVNTEKGPGDNWYRIAD